MIIDFFYVTFYQPLFNLLIFIYNVVGDLGVAIILITLLVRGILYPLSAKATRSQKALKELQPKVKEIKDEYDDDKEKQAEKVLELYNEKDVSPFSGILPLLIQFPIIIALFQIFRKGLGADQLVHLYDFIATPEVVEYVSFGFWDLSQPSVVLAVLAGIAQFVQMKWTMPSNQNPEEGGFKATLKSQIKFILPIFTVFILTRFPAAVGIYLIITIGFTAFQHKFIKAD